VTLSHFFYPAYPCATRHKTIVVKSRGGLRQWRHGVYSGINDDRSVIRRVSFMLEPNSTPALKSRATADIGYRSYAINCGTAVRHALSLRFRLSIAMRPSQ